MRGSRTLVVLIGLALLSVLLEAIPAAAIGYENSQEHYAFDAPVGWSQLQPTPPGFDVAFVADPQSNESGSIFAWALSNPGAENSSGYLLEFARSAEQAGIRAGYTLVTAPQALRLAGRPASEYTIAASNGTITVFARVVHFASVFYRIDYFLIFYARSDLFVSLEPTWTAVGNSFRVLDEPSNRTLYASSQGHYSVLGPVAWNLTSANDSVADFESPNTSDLASLIVSSFASPSAENTTAYVLHVAHDEEQRLQADGYLGVSASHAVTISNRPAAEFEMQNSSGSESHIEEWVFFASEFYQTTYVIVLLARSDRFESLRTEWNSTLNSFQIHGEGSITPSGGVPIGVAFVAQLAILIALLGAAIVIIVRSRKKKAAAAPPAAQPESPTESMPQVVESAVDRSGRAETGRSASLRRRRNS